MPTNSPDGPGVDMSSHAHLLELDHPEVDDIKASLGTPLELNRTLEPRSCWCGEIIGRGCACRFSGSIAEKVRLSARLQVDQRNAEAGPVEIDIGWNLRGGFSCGTDVYPVCRHDGSVERNRGVSVLVVHCYFCNIMPPPAGISPCSQILHRLTRQPSGDGDGVVEIDILNGM